jgi:hypothetical protein
MSADGYVDHDLGSIVDQGTQFFAFETCNEHGHDLVTCLMREGHH